MRGVSGDSFVEQDAMTDKSWTASGKLLPSRDLQKPS
jgi:hypothetical protein